MCILCTWDCLNTSSVWQQLNLETTFFFFSFFLFYLASINCGLEEIARYMARVLSPLFCGAVLR